MISQTTLPGLNDAKRITSEISFGVQLNAFPIDPSRFQTFTQALSQVRQIGYQGFESGFRNVMPQFASPTMARREIETSSLTFFGIHIFLPDEMYDTSTKIAPPEMYELVIHGGASLGAKHVILSGLPATNHDVLKRKAAALNHAARMARNCGMTAAYHNHSAEFENIIDGHTEMEGLFALTDSSIFSFVLDAGHAYRAGMDLNSFIRDHSHRIIAMHLRDYANDRLVSLGEGSFPLQDVATTIERTGWSGWVENEEERDDASKCGPEAVQTAYRALRNAFCQ